jgi:hypothetical protein
MSPARLYLRFADFIDVISNSAALDPLGTQTSANPLRELGEIRRFVSLSVPMIGGLRLVDSTMNFLPMHHDVLRTLNAKLDVSAADFQHGNYDVVANDDALSELAI